MIDVERAYIKVFTKFYPGQYSPTVLETPEHFIFYPRPNDVKPNDVCCTGTVFPAVNRITGSVSLISISEIGFLNGTVHNISLKGRSN